MANATAEVSQEVLLDVLSVLDKNEEPVYSNCSLQMGEVVLEFKNGRSKVPLVNAPEVLRNPNLMIPGYSGPAAPPVPSVAAELPEDVRQVPQESPAEREARVAAAEDYLRSQGLAVPPRDDAPVTLVPALSAEDAKGLFARVEQLEQLLAQATVMQPAQGTIAGDAEPQTAGDGQQGGQQAEDAEKDGEKDREKIPDGIEPVTPEGKPRCYARKGNGDQCDNPSAENSHACGLPAHQKLVK